MQNKQNPELTSPSFRRAGKRRTGGGESPLNSRALPCHAEKMKGKAPGTAGYGKRASAGRRGRAAKRKRAWWAVPTCIAMLTLLMLTGSFLVVKMRGYANFLIQKNLVTRTTFYPGVSVDGIDVSGMTLAQAVSDWTARDEKARASLSVTLTLGTRQWSLDANTLGYASDYRQVLMSAWSVGRYGTLQERKQAVQELGRENWGRDFSVTAKIQDVAALDNLTKLAEEMSVAPVSAQIGVFDASGLTFTHTAGRSGQVVDPEELLRVIRAAASKGEKLVQVARREVVPQDTAETLFQEYGLISSTVTNASSSSANRLTNLRLACLALNGHQLNPGEIFSFNQVVGKRTAEAGYKPAPAYESGMTTAQLGGGICQISTTLFNSAVKADMKIVERAPHSRPAQYAGAGYDAMVNWPDQDLKFINPSDQPVYIIAFEKNKKIVVQIYGKKLSGGIKIALKPETNKTYAPGAERYISDSSLLPGETKLFEKERMGYQVTTYKLYLDQNDNLLKSEPLCRSHYPPAGAVYKIGPFA